MVLNICTLYWVLSNSKGEYFDVTEMFEDFVVYKLCEFMIYIMAWSNMPSHTILW